LRAKLVEQPELRFAGPRLKLTQEYYDKYDRISRILDENRSILDLIHADLVAHEGEGDVARFRYASDVVLRVSVCQLVEGLSLRQTIVRIDTCEALRSFTRIESGKMIDFSTFCRLRNAISPGTWAQINLVLARYAVEQEAISGTSLRLDTTAVETNIHWPTDSTLLVDLYRSTKQCLDQVRDLEASLLRDRRFHLPAVRKLALRITRKGGRKGTSTDTLKPLYKRLIGQVEQILSTASKAATRLRSKRHPGPNAQRHALADRIDSLQAVGARVLSQARRRVLQGESVPNDEKIFSIFEPHSELLKRGKAGKPIEFGHRIQIQQVDEKFITDYTVFERKPAEPALLEDALASHRALFGEEPCRLAADKGYYDRTLVEELRKTIDVVSIAKKGKRTPKETEQEHDPIFRHAQRFRAGVEGTISYLKRALGLARCLCKGWKNYQSTIGASIFAHNLLILARC